MKAQFRPFPGLSVLIIVFIFSACGESDSNYPTSKGERNSGRDAGLRPPVPVVVDAPDQLSTAKMPDSTFLIFLGKQHNLVFFNGDTTMWTEIEQLDSLMDVHGAEALNGHVALQADVRGLSQTINDVIDLLKKKKIIRYNFVTDLEE